MTELLNHWPLSLLPLVTFSNDTTSLVSQIWWCVGESPLANQVRNWLNETGLTWSSDLTFIASLLAAVALVVTLAHDLTRDNAATTYIYGSCPKAYSRRHSAPTIDVHTMTFKDCQSGMPLTTLAERYKKDWHPWGWDSKVPSQASETKTGPVYV